MERTNYCAIWNTWSTSCFLNDIWFDHNINRDIWCAKLILNIFGQDISKHPVPRGGGGGRETCYFSCNLTYWYQTVTLNFSPPYTVADLRGGAGDVRPPWGSKFFQFHAVFGKFWQNRMLAPPWGVGAPSSGKSWIRHCYKIGLFTNFPEILNVFHHQDWTLLSCQKRCTFPPHPQILSFTSFQKYRMCLPTLQDWTAANSGNVIHFFLLQHL